MSYIEENRGFITSSKIKMFLEDQEAYFLKYIEGKETGDENADHFKIGTAFDDYVTYGKEYFEENYAIVSRRTEPNHFTNGQGKVLKALFYEAERQPLFDLWSKNYKGQHVIEKEWKGQKLKCTLDRVDLGNHIIEDTKTCQNIDHIGSIYKCPIKQYDYLLQASFYCLCYYVETGFFPKFYWNFFDKATASRNYSRFIRIECPMELMKEYLPLKDNLRGGTGGVASNGIISDAINAMMKAEKEGFKCARDLKHDDGFGHLKSKYYNISQGSIQKTCATYQPFCGYNE